MLHKIAPIIKTIANTNVIPSSKALCYSVNLSIAPAIVAKAAKIIAGDHAQKETIARIIATKAPILLIFSFC